MTTVSSPALEKPTAQRKPDPSSYKFIYSVVFTCFLLSGISGLIYEVVWTRMLTYVFGGTTLAVSTVLTAFLGGLALGSYLGGKFIDRFKKPLLAYGVLELAIGIYGACVPIIFSDSFLTPIWQSVVQMFESFQFVSYLVRFLISIVLLGIPTIFMGATLPVLSRYLTNVRSDVVSYNVGALYTINTIGAVLGTFISGFILLPTVGVSATVYTAAVLNLVLSSLVIFLAFSNKKVQADTPEAIKEESGVDLETLISKSQEDIPIKLIKLSMLAFVVSGFVALIFEVTWTRTLTLVFGSSTYAFSTMLTTFLVGLALGAAIMTKLQEKIERPVFWVGLILCGIGASGFITACFFNELPWMFLSQAQKLPDDPGASWFLLTVHRFIVSSAVMFLPTFLSGMIFPLVIRIYSARPDHVGESVGKLYSLNTLGCILGSFGSGFIFIPLFGIFGSGIQVTTKLAILTAIGMGLYLLYNDIQNNENLSEKQLKISTSWIYIAIGVSLFANLLVMPRWDKSIMTTGVAIYHSLSYKNLTREQFFNIFKFDNAKEKIKFYKEGLTTVVSITADENGNTTLLKNNGKVDAGVPTDGDGPSQADMVTQVLLGQLPLLLHKNEPENALVIGLGSGCTTGSVVRYPSIQSVKVCEIEKAVIDGDKYFEPPIDKSPLDGNGSPLNRLRNPLAKKVKAIHTDGRNYLLTTKEKFDIIISQPADPWVQGASQLFTKDFWELGAKHLKENGIFCEWIQLYSITPDYLGVLVNSFKQALGKYENGKKVSDGFVYLFRPGQAGEILLIGSNDPLDIDVEKIENRIKTNFTVTNDEGQILEIKTLDDLSRISIHEAVNVVAQLLLGNDEITNFCKLLTDKVPRLKSLPLEKRVNTDNNVIIEFEAPKKLHLFYAPIAENLASIGAATDGNLEKYLTNFGKSKKEQASFFARLATEHVKKASVTEPNKVKDDPDIKVAEYFAKRALELNPSVEAHIANYTVNLRKGNKIEAEHYFEAAAPAPITSVYDWIALGQLRATKEDLNGSIAAFRNATQIAPDNDKAWSKLGEAVFNKAQETSDKSFFDQALTYFRKARELFAYNIEAWSGEANVYFSYASRFQKFEYIPLAEQAYRNAFKADLNYWPTRLNYAKILYGQGPTRYEEALKEFNHIISRLNPQNGEARYLTAKILQSQGNLIPAYQQYQAALHLGIEDKQAEDTQVQLQNIQEEAQKQRGGGQQQQAQQQQAQQQQVQQQQQQEQQAGQNEEDVALQKLLRLKGNIQGEPQSEQNKIEGVTDKEKSENSESDALKQTFQPIQETQTVMTAKGTAQIKIIPPTE
ncbi:MAG: fused MFS/spermidine synthase [Candidatus Melainabacteria bacterium]|nr:fused MFS/spermidine synthase [Candidatus Melainabacteria bacterium]